MVERRGWLDVLTYTVLGVGVLLTFLPVWVTLVASTHTALEIQSAPMSLWPGREAWNNYRQVLLAGGGQTTTPVALMMFNSLVTALVIAFGKITISLLSAFALVYFRFPFRRTCFWLVFITLMLPVEVRILPSYQVVASLGLLDSYTGMTLPLIASATGTFLFRQFFLTVPDELLEAARIDGAGPLRFFWSILLPLSRTNIAALFVILFIYGWNQYLWPLLVTTQESFYTIVIGIRRLISSGDAGTDWNLVMATAVLAMVPPVLVVVLLQRWFVKGLVDSGK